MTRRMQACSCALAAALVVGLATAAEARIVKTRRGSQVGSGMEFTLGSAFEYQSDSEQTEYGFPVLLEWSLNPILSMTAEPVFIAITSTDGESVTGFDDLETTLSLELITERRTRPSFALEGGIKWPTATDEEIGTGLTDYSLGLILGKELVPAELGFNAVYSHVGVPDTGQVQNTVQFSVATEWHLTPSLDLTCELLTTQGIGSLRGVAEPADPLGVGLNVPGAGAGEFEATLGLAHYFGRRLKLEEGLTFQTDGTWQAVIAWEWDFGEGR